MKPEKPENQSVTLRSSLPPEQALNALVKLSRKGKLAGFDQLDNLTFRLQIFGNPYDHAMIGRITPADSGSSIELTTRLLRKLPTIMIVVFVLATWPGVWLTQSMMDIYFPGTLVAKYTTIVYIALMVLSIPALWKQFTKSQTAAREHTQEVTERIRTTLDAKPDAKPATD